MKWEYITINIASAKVGETPEDVANDMTCGGWELVAVDQGIMYFRREKIEIGPSEYKEDGPSEGPSV